MGKQNNSSGKIIKLSDKGRFKKRGTGPKKDQDRTGPARIMAITSGKGGVGKTNIVANLGFALTKLGKRVLIFDADLGLGNLDVLLGLAPKYDLSHVVMGGKGISDITVEGPGRMKILPAASGVQELTKLSSPQRNRLVEEFEGLEQSVDMLLIDTAAGISSNVMYFNANAEDIIVVVSPEPTAMTDAYALMKVLYLKYAESRFKVVVNLVRDASEGREVFRQLKVVTDRFLDISLEYLGHILFDENITKCVKRQRVVIESFPETGASTCFLALAKRICEEPMNSGERRRPKKFLSCFMDEEQG